MQFSDTTNQSGLVQRTEFWARLPYGSSGNLLKEITNCLNSGLDKIMPLLLARTADGIRWDDINHTDAPIGYINLVQNQNDYKVTVDDNSLDILNLSKVRILTTATGTVYTELEKMTIDDYDSAEVMSPSQGQTGVPSRWLESGNIIYLDLPPNYSATSGIELFFERQPAYFVSTDTTKTPGIPRIFHEILCLYAALEIVSVIKSEDISLLNNIKEQIALMRKDLDTFTSKKYPTRVKMSMKKIEHR